MTVKIGIALCHVTQTLQTRVGNERTCFSRNGLFFYRDNLSIFSLKLLVRAGFKSMWQTLVEGKMLWNFMAFIIYQESPEVCLSRKLRSAAETTA